MIPEAMDTPFVFVAGGKGGVGKSVLSANLAIQMAREGRRVLLVDFDLGLGNLDVLLRVRTGSTMVPLLEGKIDPWSALREGPCGLRLLPAGSGDPKLVREDESMGARLLSIVGELASDFDVVIGDGAAGIGPEVLDPALGSDCVLVVTTPEPTALTDAYGLLKALDRRAYESGVELPTPELCVNQVSGSSDAEATASKLRSICERFLARSPRLAGWLPRSSEVIQSCLRRRPFVLGCEETLERACIRRLSQRVDRMVQPRNVQDSLLKA